jgi:hypothetical protein
LDPPKTHPGKWFSDLYSFRFLSFILENFCVPHGSRGNRSTIKFACFITILLENIKNFLKLSINITVSYSEKEYNMVVT